MIYTPHNTGLGATVHVAGQKAPLRGCMTVDTDLATVEATAQPLQVTADGFFVTETHQFSVVFPLFGGYKAPIAFVCIP